MNRLLFCRISLRLALLLSLAGCAGTMGIVSHEPGQKPAPASREETRLWSQGEDFDRAVRLSGRLVADPELQSYLQGIADRIYPEFGGCLQVGIVRSPLLNAFVLPHGSIYVHTGLLARIENEAQLATVLAHEGGHFVHRHALRQAKNIKVSAAFAQSIALAGLPLAGPILAVSSIAGYSRDLEREADAVAFERLRQAGYDTREGIAVFRRMAAEAKALDTPESFFFSSHPRMQERIESFEELSGSNPGTGGEVGEEDYLRKTAGLRLACLEDDLSMSRFQSLILVLEDEKLRRLYPPQALYYLGEAYRLRQGAGDAERAEQTWRETVAASPGFAPSFRALGLHYLKERDAAKAENYLRRYLELSPDAEDGKFVLRYLEELSGRER